MLLELVETTTMKTRCNTLLEKIKKELDNENFIVRPNLVGAPIMNKI